MGRLALDALRPGHGVVIGRGLACRLQPLRHELDGVVALAMDHHERLLAARAVEHFQELAVVQDQVVIGHEHLE